MAGLSHGLLARAVEALGAFGVGRLPDDALSEDQDNADASHAVQLHLESLGSGLNAMLMAAADAVTAIPNEEGADQLWTMLSEAGSEPKSLTTFLYRLVIQSVPANLSDESSSSKQSLASTTDCLIAATIYFSLLRLPGARNAAYSASTLRAFMKCIERISGNMDANPASTKKKAGKRKRANTSTSQNVAANVSIGDILNTSLNASSSALNISASRRSERHASRLMTSQLDMTSVGAESDDEDAEPGEADAALRPLMPEEASLERAMGQMELFLSAFSLQTNQEALTHCLEVTVRVLFTSPYDLRPRALACARAALSRTHGPPHHTAPIALKCLVQWLSEPASPSAGATAKEAMGLVEGLAAESRAGEEAGEEREAVMRCIMTLCQQLCIRVTDRAPVRSHASTVIVGYMDIMGRYGGSKWIAEMSSFACKLARNAKPHYRVFAVELAADALVAFTTPASVGEEILSASILDESHCGDAVMATEDRERTDDDDAPSDGPGMMQAASRNLLLDTIKLRSSDKNPMVRTKALTCVAAVIPSLLPAPSFWVPTYCAPSPAQEGGAPGPIDAFPALSAAGASPLASPGSPAAGFADVVVRRCKDARSAVRAAAVKVLEAKGGEGGVPLTPADLAALEERTLDLSVQVRKRALDALSSFAPLSIEAATAWVRSGLPLARDPESSVVDRTVNSVIDLIIGPLAAGTPKSPVSDLTWRIISLIGEEERPLLQLCCRLCSKRRPSALPAQLLKRLMTLLADTPSKSQLWWLAEEACAQQPGGANHVLLKSACEGAGDEAPSALRCMAKIAPHLPSEEARALADKMIKRIGLVNTPPQVAGDLIKCAAALRHAAAPGDKTWAAPLFNTLADALQPHVQARLAESPCVSTHTQLVNAVFAAGALAMVDGATCPTRLVNSIQALFDPQRAQSHAELCLQGHVIAALGKVCLQDAALAKKCLMLFLRELDTTPSAVLRNNVLVVLTDLCVRYTSLVDPHLPRVAMCLRDPNEVVRQHALVLITNLLTTDYIKWRGPLFFRYLVALVDESPVIKQQARTCLLKVLHPKSGNHICHVHLCESIFVLNDYAEHPIYNQYPTGADERARFSLAGDARSRREVYALLLSECNDEQRFQTTSKLCEEVLGAVADGAIPLGNADGVLGDALHILASKEIRLSAVQRFASAAAGLAVEEADEPSSKAPSMPGGAVAAAAKSKLLSQIVKRNVMQNVIPTLAALKAVMEKAHSPLLGALMACLGRIMHDYRSEIDDVFMTNKQLAKELEYDLRLAETKKASQSTPSSPATSVMGSSSKLKRKSLSSPALMPPPGSAKKGTPLELSIPRLSASKAGGGRTARFSTSGVSPAVIDFPAKGVPTGVQDAENAAPQGRASKRART